MTTVIIVGNRSLKKLPARVVWVTLHQKIEVTGPMCVGGRRTEEDGVDVNLSAAAGK